MNLKDLKRMSRYTLESTKNSKINLLTAYEIKLKQNENDDLKETCKTLKNQIRLINIELQSRRSLLDFFDEKFISLQKT